MLFEIEIVCTNSSRNSLVFTFFDLAGAVCAQIRTCLRERCLKMRGMFSVSGASCGIDLVRLFRFFFIDNLGEN